MKKSMSVSLKNAEINLEDMTITEYNKDSTETFDLMEILKEWDKVSGISFTVKKEDEIKSNSDGEDEVK
jgi:hypothetical protein